jgi:hypothetical protein
VITLLPFPVNKKELICMDEPRYMLGTEEHRPGTGAA